MHVFLGRIIFTLLRKNQDLGAVGESSYFGKCTTAWEIQAALKGTVSEGGERYGCRNRKQAESRTLCFLFPEVYDKRLKSSPLSLFPTSFCNRSLGCWNKLMSICIFRMFVHWSERQSLQPERRPAFERDGLSSVASPREDDSKWII